MSKSIAEQEKFPDAKNNERTMVMLECRTDSCDFASRFGGIYKNELLKFLIDLGFDASFKYDTSTDVIIDGIEIKVDYSAESTMGEQAYTRKKAPRKNRQIKLCKGFDESIAIIPINKPTDKLRLIAKIQSHVDERKAYVAKREKEEKDKETFFTALGDKYGKKITDFANAKVNDGIFTISTHTGTFTVEPDGTVSDVHLFLPKVESLEDFNMVVTRVTGIHACGEKTIKEIKAIGATGITPESPEGNVYFGEGEINIH